MPTRVVTEICATNFPDTCDDLAAQAKHQRKRCCDHSQCFSRVVKNTLTVYLTTTIQIKHINDNAAKAPKGGCPPPRKMILIVHPITALDAFQAGDGGTASSQLKLNHLFKQCLCTLVFFVIIVDVRPIARNALAAYNTRDRHAT
jgi:hypothetical protein